MDQQSVQSEEEEGPEGWHLPLIDEGLYLGNKEMAANMDWLERAGISRIVSCIHGKKNLLCKEDEVVGYTRRGVEVRLQRMSRALNDGSLTPTHEIEKFS